MKPEELSSGLRFSIIVRNVQEKGVTLILEPRGIDFSMPPGAAYEVRAEGPEGGNVEIDFEPDTIVLWGWTGSVFRVFDNGVELRPGRFGPPLPVPPTPEGMSVRDFLRKIIQGDS
jgi:hypothetical protein